MPVLVPCPSCARHIATSEAACPFCATSITEDLAARAIPGTTRRMSRFAMFTFATTVTALGAIGGCDNGDDMGSGVAEYGTSVCDDGCGAIDAGAATHYGLPDAQFLDDASPDATDASLFVDDGGDSGDAGEDAD